MSHDGGGALRILLLGATGRVGRLLRAAWDEAVGPGAQLVPVARSPAPGCLTWAPGDDMAVLPRVDAIAALWGVIPGEGRDLSDNTALARQAQALGAALGARVVLHASSVAVYPPCETPVTEDVLVDPPNAYGAAKVDMEEALAAEGGGAPRPVALRMGSVAGAESLFAALGRGGPVTLDRFWDGQGPVRSYIAPSDLARVIAALAAGDPAGLPFALNLGGAHPAAMADIAAAAGRNVTWQAAPAAARQRVILDTARLQALCPLDPERSRPERLVAEWRRLAGVPA